MPNANHALDQIADLEGKLRSILIVGVLKDGNLTLINGIESIGDAAFIATAAQLIATDTLRAALSDSDMAILLQGVPPNGNGKPS